MSINAKSQRRTRHRRAQVASVAAAAAAAAAASLGVEPQAEAPHSALVAPRARAARCVGAFAAAPAQHARTQRHRSVLLPRARGIRPKALCVLELIASAARARQGARRRSAPVDGKWRECCQQICRPRAQHASVVSARARAGPTRESDRSSSVARARYAEARFSCTVVFAVIFECRVHEP